MVETKIVVRGMTCGHCVASVTEELSALGGVDDVAVDLASGTVVIQAQDTLPAAEVRRAVVEAGYELADDTDRGE